MKNESQLVIRRMLAAVLATSVVLSSGGIGVFAEESLDEAYTVEGLAELTNEESGAESDDYELENDDTEGSENEKTEIDEEVTEETGKTQPTITIEADEYYCSGEAYQFAVTSDMSGILSVSLSETSEMIVEGQPIVADEPYTVMVDEMPDVDVVNFIITVRPENNDISDLDNLAVASMETLTVYRDPDSVTPALSIRQDASDWQIDNLIGTSSTVKGTMYVDGDSIVSTGADGKVASAENMGHFMYREIDDSSVNFRISASIEITSLANGAVTASNQAVAGLMLTDSTTGDNSPGTVIAGYTWASTTTGTPIIYRAKGASSISRVSAGALSVTEGTVLDVEMVKLGDVYYCYIDGSLAYQTSGSFFNSEDPLYVGLFVCRGINATFTNLEFEILDVSSTPSRLSITEPDNTTYLQNTDAVLTGLAVEVICEDGSSRTLTSDEYTLTGLSTSVVGNYTATVHYRGATGTFDYTVDTDYVTKLDITVLPLYLSYAINEKFDATGMEVQATMASGEVNTLFDSDYTLSKPDMSTADTKTITVTYGGESATFEIEVKGITTKELTTSSPQRTTFYLSDTAPTEQELLTGSIVTVKYSDDSQKVLSYGDYETDYNPSTFLSSAGTVDVELSYVGASTVLSFDICDVALSELILVDYPTTTYVQGEALNLSGHTVYGKYNDGSETDNALIENTDYTFDTSAYDSENVGVYTIVINGEGDYIGLSGSFTVSVREYVDYSEGWQHVRFGQSASISGNTLTMVNGEFGTVGDDVSVRLTTTDGKGKVADGHDGINYYYMALDPNDNFVLTADVEVVTFSNLDTSIDIYGQEAFGIMLRDRIADDGDTSVWSSSVFFAGTRGSTAWRAFYRDNRNEYENGVTATNTAISLTGSTLTDFDRSGGTNSSKATITIEKKNNNFSGSITVDGATSYFSYDNDIPFDYYDEDYMYVGFFTARNADIIFSNATLTVTDSASDPAGPVIEKTATTPKVTIHSLTESSSEDYTLTFSSNANGTANIYKNSSLIATVEVTENTIVKTDTTLSSGTNTFFVEFFPSASGYYSSYDKLLISRTVTLLDGMDTIYVSPSGSGDGSYDTPMSFTNALRYIKPGGTIVLLEGGYGTLTIPMYNNGSEGNYKTIVAEGNVTTGNVVISGDYWHVKGFTVQNANVRIGGNDNIIELLTVYGSNNTGVQISRTGDSSLYYNVATWPSRNIILNCESYNHKDDAENDADGFAAKLTVGEGNMFIGCVSHHNVDDGWDLYAKSVPIGAIVIDSCIAFHNGHVLGSTEQRGDGNGFKLGGEGVAITHEIRNSIAFQNNADGYTSNSNPTLIAENNVSFDNGGANINFTSYTNVYIRSYQVSNFYSYRKEVFSSSADKIETINDSGSVISGGSAPDIYLCNSSGVSKNSLGRVVTDAFFVSVDAPTEAVSDNETLYNYSRDESITNTAGGTYRSNIIWGDFLKLTDYAYDHYSLDDDTEEETPTITAEAPTISSQSESVSVTQNGSVTLSVNASVSDSGTLSYQWYTSTGGSGASGIAIEGATGSTYATSISVAGTYYYYVVITNTVTNADGETTTASSVSNIITVTVTSTSSGDGNAGDSSGNSSGGSSSSSSDSSSGSTSSTDSTKTSDEDDNLNLIDEETPLYGVIVSKSGIQLSSNENGYISGFTDGTFRPDVAVTRGQVMVMLYQLVNNKDYWGTTEVSFSDLTGDEYYYEAIMYFAGHGILSGYPDGTFNPDGSITRAEVATILSHFIAEDEEDYATISFSDVSEHWAEKSIVLLASMGIISGYPDGTFRPDNQITRAEITTLINKTMGVDSVASSEGKTNPFMDITESHWAYYEVLSAAKQN